MGTPPSDIEIEDCARFAAQAVLALRDSEPERAARIEAWARRRCETMRAQQRAAASR